MFDSIQTFFRDRLAPAGDPDEDVRRLRVATGVLLLEVAHADSDFAEGERTAIEEMLGRRFGLSDAETTELLEMAEQTRRANDDLYEFARLINEHYPTARKLAIAQLLWEVVYQDGVLEAREDALMHKLGRLLGLRHEQLMALKVQVKRARED